ncbi:MAG: hypothetical protein AAF665_02830 [Pseudomonadota bacterium]
MAAREADETGRFMRAIAAFSAAPEEIDARGRRLQVQASAALAAILTEIDETVLRRALTFRRDDGCFLTIDVAERRITKILKTDSNSPKAPKVIGRPLEPADALDILSLLQAYAEAQSVFWVTSELPEQGSAACHSGVSAGELLQLESQAPSTLSLPVEVATKLEQSRSMALAVLCLTGSKPVLKLGEPDFIDALERLLPVLPDAREPGATLKLFSGGLRANSDVLTVQYRSIRLGFVLEHGETIACLSLWQSLLGQA